MYNVIIRKMGYRKSDLDKNTFPLVYEIPPDTWLDKNWKTWRADMHTDPHRYQEEIEMYDFNVVNSNDPLALRSCHICQLGFLTGTFRMMHLDTYEHTVAQAKQKGLPIPDNPLFCKLCDFRAHSNRKMEFHKRSFTHEKNLAIENGLFRPHQRPIL